MKFLKGLLATVCYALLAAYVLLFSTTLALLPIALFKWVWGYVVLNH